MDGTQIFWLYPHASIMDGQAIGQTHVTLNVTLMSIKRVGCTAGGAKTADHVSSPPLKMKDARFLKRYIAVHVRACFVLLLLFRLSCVRVCVLQGVAHERFSFFCSSAVRVGRMSKYVRKA